MEEGSLDCCQEHAVTHVRKEELGLQQRDVRKRRAALFLLSFDNLAMEGTM
jgi:hypothetical protein